TSRAGDSDTSRFLTAGARRALWVRTKQGWLAEAMPALRARLKDADNVIIESNSVMKFLHPDLYLSVLDPATADFKASAREFLDRAGAVLVHGPLDSPQWKGVSLKLIADKPVFAITPPVYLPEGLAMWVRERLVSPRV